MTKTDNACADCGRTIDPLETFPKQRCVECHAVSPEVVEQTFTMTAEKLARMWGAR
jgi:protein-arginine kinase activator protein McsA